MGFFDSFKTGIGAVGDFLGDITGLALQAAPSVIPLLQSTGVIPQIQPSPIITSRGPGAGPLGVPRGTVLPGGFVTQFPQIPRVNPLLARQQGVSPVGFPTSQPTAFPTSPAGVVQMPSFQSTRGGFQTAGLSLPSTSPFDLPFIDIVGQGGGNQLARLTSPFVPTMAGARAQPFIASNPVTGASTWFKPAGRPILWSGDLTACKRVGKIAMRARRAKR